MAEQLGRYEIEEKIGEGGFAIVYRGRDTSLDRLVALKELRPLLLQDAGWVKRFKQEAVTIARLDHPHIVPVYDIYEAEQRLFIIMRLVDGPSLDAQLLQTGPLDWEATLLTFLPIAAGLNFAHGQDILHRDLKPANILIDAERGAMLSDFGLAKILGRHSMSMTESGSIVGTPHYIAPEVWEGQKADARADIYALGCILYEIVTGEKFFKGETPPAVMMAHFKPLSLPTQWPDAIPNGLSDILHTSLARDPAERYATPLEMAEALRALAPEFASSINLTGLLNAQSRPTTPPPAPPPAIKTESLPISNPPPPQPSPPPTPPPASPPTPSPIPTPEPEPTPPPAAAPKRGGRGCLRRGAVVGLLVALVLVVGVGSFCAAAGSRVWQPLQPLANAVTDSVNVGNTITKTVQIPIPDAVDTARLEIEIPTGRLSLGSTVLGDDLLLAGSAAYNVAELQPVIVNNAEITRLKPQGDTSNSLILMVYDLINNDIINVWDFTLSTFPTDLTVTTGPADSQVQFGPVALVDLTLNLSLGTSFDLAFEQPNQTTMETLAIKSGPMRRVSLTGLANARAHTINLDVSGGEYTLNFSGDLTESIDVNLSGDNGTFNFIFPPEASVSVIVADANTPVDAPQNWNGSDSTFSHPGPGPAINVVVEALESAVKLRNQ